MFNASESKYNAIERAKQIFQDMAHTMKSFRNGVTGIREKVDQYDLTYLPNRDVLGFEYQTLVQEMIFELNNIIRLRRDTVSDNGALLIHQVRDMPADYKTEIWYGHVDTCCNKERRYPVRVVCVYDNISLVTLYDTVDTTKIIGFDIRIGKKTYTINTRESIDFDAPNDDIIIVLQSAFDDIILVSSLIQECFNINVDIICNYGNDFKRLYMNKCI